MLAEMLRRYDAMTLGRAVGRTGGRAVALALLSALLGGPVTAQITTAEYQARRDSLAARVGDGIVVAFGGRTPVTDFGPFFQIPAFRYLTGYKYADAAFVMPVRGGKGAGILFVARTAPRRALYYGSEPDSAALARDLGLVSRAVGELAAPAVRCTGRCSSSSARSTISRRRTLPGRIR